MYEKNQFSFKKCIVALKRWLKNNAITTPLLSALHHWKYKKWHNKPLKDVFETIYHQNHWNSAESVSGSGSELAQTEKIRLALPELFQNYHIQTVADIPCGDFNWMRNVDLSSIQQYIGGDIVASLIQHNKKNYTTKKITFEVIDLTQDLLPEVDLLIVRDCWVHLSFENIKKCIQNIQKSNITYLLTTTFTQQKYNTDIVTGSWRPINLQQKPFHFPPPLLLIQEESNESEGEFSDKSLGLWKIDKIVVSF
jgi:hypothetical protein